MNTFRSLAYNAAFIVWSTIVCVFFLWPLLFLPRDTVQAAARFWTRSVVAIMRWFAGLHYEVRGGENLLPGNCIVACKHQSAWETILFNILVHDPAYVLKRELFRIPFFGWYLERAGNIGIDRSAGASALKFLIRSAEIALNRGQTIVIFPEGTRSHPGTTHAYHPGIAALYSRFDVPVIPAALNSGLFWPPRSWRKFPGKIVIEFLPALPAGLNRKAFLATLQDSIETATTRLEAEARATYPRLPVPHAAPEPELQPAGTPVEE